MAFSNGSTGGSELGETIGTQTPSAPTDPTAAVRRRVGRQVEHALGVVGMALADFERQHPGVLAAVCRPYQAALTVGIVDPAYEGMDETQRRARFWSDFGHLADEEIGWVTALRLFTPQEMRCDHVNRLIWQDGGLRLPDQFATLDMEGSAEGSSAGKPPVEQPSAP